MALAAQELAGKVVLMATRSTSEDPEEDRMFFVEAPFGETVQGRWLNGNEVGVMPLRSIERVVVDEDIRGAGLWNNFVERRRQFESITPSSYVDPNAEFLPERRGTHQERMAARDLPDTARSARRVAAGGPHAASPGGMINPVGPGGEVTAMGNENVNDTQVDITTGTPSGANAQGLGYTEQITAVNPGAPVQRGTTPAPPPPPAAGAAGLETASPIQAPPMGSAGRGKASGNLTVAQQEEEQHKKDVTAQKAAAAARKDAEAEADKKK